MVNNDKIPELSSAKFEEFVSKGIVLIDFFAEWCMPCLMMAPIVEEISEKFKGKIKFGKFNIDDNHELSQKYGVGSIPNFVLFKDGKVIGQFIGAISEEDFERRLKEII